MKIKSGNALASICSNIIKMKIIFHICKKRLGAIKTLEDERFLPDILALSSLHIRFHL